MPQRHLAISARTCISRLPREDQLTPGTNLVTTTASRDIRESSHPSACRAKVRLHVSWTRGEHTRDKHTSQAHDQKKKRRYTLKKRRVTMSWIQTWSKPTSSRLTPLILPVPLQAFSEASILHYRHTTRKKRRHTLKKARVTMS